MADVALSRLFFDIQRPEAAAAYRADPEGVRARYGLSPKALAALAADDVAAIAPVVNAYLLRYYFQVRGLTDAEFIARLNAPPLTEVLDG